MAPKSSSDHSVCLERSHQMTAICRLRQATHTAGAPSTRRTIVAIAGQVAAILFGFLAYMAVRVLARGDRDVALRHGHDVLEFERSIGLDWEHGLQNAVVGHAAAREVFNAVYAWAYWPALIGTLAYLWRCDRSLYFRFRNALAVSGLTGLVIFAVFPVAPPRMLEGFTDTVSSTSRQHLVAHPAGLVNPYAALPSFHAGWFLLAALVLGKSIGGWPSRFAGAVAAALMSVAVVVTANHFIIDVAAGITLSLAGLAVADRLHRATAIDATRNPTSAVDTAGRSLRRPEP